MASPAEVGQNIPETLPADFGEWDSSDSQAAPPVEIPPRDPREVAPKESQQREFARREAEAIDSAKRPYLSREVSREFEPAGNVTPFPQPEAGLTVPKGIPAPAVRAPRTSPAAPMAAAAVADDTTFLRRMKSVDTVVDTLPGLESRLDEVIGGPVPLLDRKPDKPLFSSIAVEELDTVDTEDGPRLLNDLIEQEQERKTRRKWITSGCVFGGALLLVAFQLFHYGTAGKIKHIVAPTQAATTVVTEPDPETIADIKPTAAKPSPVKEAGNSELQSTESTPAKATEKAPAPGQTQMMQSQLTAPTRLPQNLKTVAPDDAPPPSAIGGASIAAMNGNNTGANIFAGGSGANVSGPKVVNVSAGVAVGMLIRKTQPIYPSIARSARVQGTVVLQAKISPFGKVTNLQVVSGPPMLRQAAIDAVKTWQYKPYTLNNQPTEVDTSVNVVFSLGG